MARFRLRPTPATDGSCCSRACVEAMSRQLKDSATGWPACSWCSHQQRPFVHKATVHRLPSSRPRRWHHSAGGAPGRGCDSCAPTSLRGQLSSTGRQSWGASRATGRKTVGTSCTIRSTGLSIIVQLLLQLIIGVYQAVEFAPLVVNGITLTLDIGLRSSSSITCTFASWRTLRSIRTGAAINGMTVLAVVSGCRATLTFDVDRNSCGWDDSASGGAVAAGFHCVPRAADRITLQWKRSEAPSCEDEIATAVCGPGSVPSCPQLVCNPCPEAAMQASCEKTCC